MIFFSLATLNLISLSITRNFRKKPFSNKLFFSHTAQQKIFVSYLPMTWTKCCHFLGCIICLWLMNHEIMVAEPIVRFQYNGVASTAIIRLTYWGLNKMAAISKIEFPLSLNLPVYIGFIRLIYSLVKAVSHLPWGLGQERSLAGLGISNQITDKSPDKSHWSPTIRQSIFQNGSYNTPHS